MITHRRCRDHRQRASIPAIAFMTQTCSADVLQVTIGCIDAIKHRRRLPHPRCRQKCRNSPRRQRPQIDRNGMGLRSATSANAVAQHVATSERLPSAATLLDVIVSFEWSQSKQPYLAPTDALERPQWGTLEMNWRTLSPTVPTPANAIRRQGDKAWRSPRVKKNMFEPPQARL